MPDELKDRDSSKTAFFFLFKFLVPNDEVKKNSQEIIKNHLNDLHLTCKFQKIDGVLVPNV